MSMWFAENMGVLNEKMCKNKKQTLSMHFFNICFCFSKAITNKTRP
jgi:hypothetical protein